MSKNKEGLVFYKSLLNITDINMSDRLLLSALYKLNRDLERKIKSGKSLMSNREKQVAEMFGVCISIGALSELTGLCERTIKYRIKYLQSNDYLEKTSRRFNYYKINYNKLKLGREYIYINFNILKNNSYSVTEKVLLSLISSYNRANKLFYVKNKTLSDSLGVTLPSIRTAFYKFKGLKVIKVEEGGVKVDLEEVERVYQRARKEEPVKQAVKEGKAVYVVNKEDDKEEVELYKVTENTLQDLKNEELLLIYKQLKTQQVDIAHQIRHLTEELKKRTKDKGGKIRYD